MDTGKLSTSSDQSCQEHANSLTRRNFICLSSGCAFAASAAAPQAQAAWGDPIAAGALKDYTTDEISEKYVQYNFFMIRNKGRLYATVATCPHKGNALFRDTTKPTQIACSGHDAVFDPEGKPLGGPVHRGLERFGIAVDAQGIVRVDTNKHFAEDQWSAPGSYVEVKGDSGVSKPAEKAKEVPKRGATRARPAR
jgi:nitrite reductase/ring-hydroxylating ferredoxin subunit